MQRYDPAAVEAKWQKVWEDAEAFITPNPEPGEDASRLQYVLEMLPYPSGDLHMGHVKNYTIGDALCHQRRRHGLRVLHPMGYDAFGLPAENAAIREGRHPRDVTNDNIAAIRKQMKRMGWSIDWSRELSTAEPEYYRWTQWIFLLLFERGLANKREAPGQLVPGRPDGARQRAGHRRPLRALRRAGREPHAGAVVLLDHRLRPAAAGRHGAARGLARARALDAAQLDRPLRGRRGAVPPARSGRVDHASSRRGRTRSTARRSSSWRPSIR